MDMRLGQLLRSSKGCGIATDIVDTGSGLKALNDVCESIPSTGCTCLIHAETSGKPRASSSCVDFVGTGDHTCYGAKETVVNYSKVGLALAWALVGLCLLAFLTGSCQVWASDKKIKEKRKNHVKKEAARRQIQAII